jgi:low affinity Fe/Cu permease
VLLKNIEYYDNIDTSFKVKELIMEIEELKKRFYEDLENKTPEEMAKELEQTSEDGIGAMIVRAWADDEEFFEEEDKSDDK